MYKLSYPTEDGSCWDVEGRISIIKVITGSLTLGKFPTKRTPGMEKETRILVPDSPDDLQIGVLNGIPSDVISSGGRYTSVNSPDVILGLFFSKSLHFFPPNQNIRQPRSIPQWFHKLKQLLFFVPSLPHYTNVVKSQCREKFKS